MQITTLDYMKRKLIASVLIVVLILVAAHIGHDPQEILTLCLEALIQALVAGLV